MYRRTSFSSPNRPIASGLPGYPPVSSASDLDPFASLLHTDYGLPATYGTSMSPSMSHSSSLSSSGSSYNPSSAYSPPTAYGAFTGYGLSTLASPGHQQTSFSDPFVRVPPPKLSSGASLAASGQSYGTYAAYLPPLSGTGPGRRSASPSLGLGIDGYGGPSYGSSRAGQSSGKQHSKSSSYTGYDASGGQPSSSFASQMGSGGMPSSSAMSASLSGSSGGSGPSQEKGKRRRSAKEQSAVNPNEQCVLLSCYQESNSSSTIVCCKALRTDQFRFRPSLTRAPRRSLRPLLPLPKSSSRRWSGCQASRHAFRNSNAACSTSWKNAAGRQ